MIKSVEGARVTEGDVENKVVWPFLTGPDFLNIPASAIASKRYLPARDLGKGNSLIRGYTPDYIVYSNKLPIMIVEAKAPDEPVSKGYREARLYASEIDVPPSGPSIIMRAQRVDSRSASPAGAAVRRS